MKQSQKDKELVFITKRQIPSPENTSHSRMSPSPSHSRSGLTFSKEDAKMIEMQREEIKRLRKRMSELEAAVSISKPKTPYLSELPQSPLLDFSLEVSSVNSLKI
jgi:hypothetical protein